MTPGVCTQLIVLSEDETRAVDCTGSGLNRHPLLLRHGWELCRYVVAIFSKEQFSGIMLVSKDCVAASMKGFKRVPGAKIIW